MITWFFSLLGHFLSWTAALAYLIFPVLIGSKQALADSRIRTAPFVNSPVASSSFLFNLDFEPTELNAVYLSYKVNGVNGTANYGGSRKSINGVLGFGGRIALPIEKYNDTFDVSEAVPLQILRKGTNTVLFLPNDFGHHSPVHSVYLNIQRKKNLGDSENLIVFPSNDKSTPQIFANLSAT
jgi:hypothetical protein